MGLTPQLLQPSAASFCLTATAWRHFFHPLLRWQPYLKHEPFVTCIDVPGRCHLPYLSTTVLEDRLICLKEHSNGSVQLCPLLPHCPATNPRPLESSECTCPLPSAVSFPHLTLHHPFRFSCNIPSSAKISPTSLIPGPVLRALLYCYLIITTPLESSF